MSNIDVAYNFYSKHIYDEEKIKLLTKYNLKIAGSVPSVLWELFGALITGRPGNGITGADLIGWEVKSAKFGGSFEYQYHLNTGANKLKEDCIVNHLFCSYSETYKDVVVQAMRGNTLQKKYFKAWEPQYASNYDAKIPSDKRRQRFRKSISHGYVNTNGMLILSIENGKLVNREDEILHQLNMKNR